MARVILQRGTNDARENVPKAIHDSNIAEILQKLRTRSIKVVILENSMLSDLRVEYPIGDGIHMSAEGYTHLASRLLPLVMRRLGR
jgi:lysophospholipase L1-like esterase